MNIEELKKMLKNSTSVLIMENGEPAFVVVNYDTYKNITGDGDEIKVRNGNSEELKKQEEKTPANEVEILERINKDILALKAEIESEEKVLGVDPALGG